MAQQMTKQEINVIAQKVADYYLGSRDFNGLPLRNLRASQPMPKWKLRDLIISGKIVMHFGYGHPNPHVMALPLGDKEAQLKMLKATLVRDMEHTVLYPTKKYLASVVDPKNYEHRPYELELARGEPSLEYRCFEPQLLRQYRDDPRYVYRFRGVAGTLAVGDDAFADANFPDKDKILLQNFGSGFSKTYDSDHKTCIVAFLHDLSRLSPEHQQMWKQRELPADKYRAERGFMVALVLGSWDYDTPIYEALLAELKVINKMAVAIEGQPLFKEDFSGSTMPPRNFHRLLIPTKREYYEFVETLDKLMSDNLNRSFFIRRFPVETADTSVGSIQLLEYYFNLLRFEDRKPVDNMLKTFRAIRRIRSKSSHHNVDDEFGHKYNEEQRKLMVRAYTAIRLIRLAFTNAPAAKDIEVSGWLYKGEITTY